MRGGTGIVGYSVSSFGNPLTVLNAAAESGTGVFRKSGSGLGEYTGTASNVAVFGKSGSGFGVHGDSDSNTAVFGRSGSGIGAHGTATTVPGHWHERIRLRRPRRPVTIAPAGCSSEENPTAAREMASPKGLSPAPAAANCWRQRRSGPAVQIWFCTRAGDAAAAAWDLVAGSRPFPARRCRSARERGLKRIQMRLNMVFGTDLNGDGEFGPIARDAVVAFQAQEQNRPDRCRRRRHVGAAAKDLDSGRIVQAGFAGFAADGLATARVACLRGGAHRATAGSSGLFSHGWRAEDRHGCADG